MSLTSLASLLAALPKPGTPHAGGIYAGLITDADGQPYALVLLADKPPKRLNWQDSVAWAESLGGGASLPDRVEGALLYARLKDQFDPNWHWLSEQYAAGGAWNQGFDDGDQGGDVKSFEARARAVRRLPLQSFDSSEA